MHDSTPNASGSPNDSSHAWFDVPKLTIADVIAGLSVAVVLIPQSLAYAQLAELPAVVGLFASALPLIVMALMASSPYLQTGPVALTSLLTLAALQAAGFDASGSDYVAAASLLALIVGATRFALGALKLGKVAFLISEPVRIGFTSGAAIVILSSQLPKALGASDAVAEALPGGSVPMRALWAVTHPADWSLAAIGLSAITLVAMLGGRKLHRLFPGVAAAVVIGLAAERWTGLDTVLVGDSNPIPDTFPSLSLALPWEHIPSLLLGGVIIALVGFAEPTSIARLFAAADKTRWNANRELVASGLANSAAALSGAFPVGGSFSRSSINRLAGARTRLSGAVTGLAVLLFIPFAGILNSLPEAILGAIVVGAVIGLVKPKQLIALWRRSRQEAFLAWATFIATLYMTPSVHWAVIGGVVLTLLKHFVSPLRLHRSAHDSGDVTVTADGLVWLLNRDRFVKEVAEAVTKNPDAAVTIDFSSMATVDRDAIEEIRALRPTSRGSLTLANLPD